MPRRAVPVTLALIIVAPAVWSQVPLGSDFQVNTYTTGSQTYASVAADTNSTIGNFMVVWDNWGLDSVGTDVFARRYDATGTPFGEEFRVNSYSTGQQVRAKVASGPSGDFVVVWLDFHAGDRIVARLFDAAGLPAGPEFQVNTDTSGTDQLADVAMDAAGDFVVVWENIFGDYNIWTRHFSAAGVALSPALPVNSYDFSQQRLPAVAIAYNGTFVVVWTSYGQDGHHLGVFGQRFYADGERIGAEFQVNTYTTGAQSYPHVASDPVGNFLVVWSSDGQDGDGLGVYGRHYDAAGVPQGGEFRVNTWTFSSQQFPDVTADASGAFVVAWQSYLQDGSLNGVFGRTVRASAAPGPEVQMNSYTTGMQTVPAVAADGRGNIVAVWLSEQDGSGRGVFGRRFEMDVIFKDGFES